MLILNRRKTESKSKALAADKQSETLPHCKVTKLVAVPSILEGGEIGINSGFRA